MSKSSDLQLQIQAEQHNRTEAAEQQHREYMAYGEAAERSELDIINDSFQNVKDAIGKLTSNPLEISLIMQIVEGYGDVREAFGNVIPNEAPECPSIFDVMANNIKEAGGINNILFGSTLTDEEADYVRKMHP